MQHKKEEVRPDNTYQNFDEAKVKLFKYRKSVYNNKRIHSAINYKTSNEAYARGLVGQNISKRSLLY